MKFIHISFLLLLIGCAQNATVEIGFNDSAILKGSYGDLIITVSKIEMYQTKEFVEIWSGINKVSVPVGGNDYYSITGGYIPVAPGSYKKLRITIDSLIYKIDNTTVILLDSTYQFIASAFTDILIEDNEEYRLLVSIASTNWFDPVAQKIKTGHQPFEGANLKIYY